MTTIVSPEKVFLDERSYEEFLQQVSTTFQMFLSRFEITVSGSGKGLSKKIWDMFEAKNYQGVGLALEENMVWFVGIEGYTGLVKDMQRLVHGQKVRDALFDRVQNELVDILDLGKQESSIDWMLNRLDKHRELEHRKVLLRAHEKIIFSTKGQLCSHLSNEQVHQKYKSIIRRIAEAEINAKLIGRI